VTQRKHSSRIRLFWQIWIRRVRPKKAEWEVIVSTRNEELLALADTIKVLNDDDVLELM